MLKHSNYSFLKKWFSQKMKELAAKIVISASFFVGIAAFERDRTLNDCV